MFKWLKKIFKKREVVYCKDCRWCKPAMGQKSRIDVNNPIWRYAECKSPKNKEKIKSTREYKELILVADGDLKEDIKYRPIWVFCSTLRRFDCGKKGKWFEAKKEEK